MYKCGTGLRTMSPIYNTYIYNKCRIYWTSSSYTWEEEKDKKDRCLTGFVTAVCAGASLAFRQQMRNKLLFKDQRTLCVVILFEISQLVFIMHLCIQCVRKWRNYVIISFKLDPFVTIINGFFWRLKFLKICNVSYLIGKYINLLYCNTILNEQKNYKWEIK